MKTGNENKNTQTEYLIQGLEDGIVKDCLTAYGFESMEQKASGNWSTWFEEVAIYDITNPASPVFIQKRKAGNECPVWGEPFSLREAMTESERPF